ncbi:MAG: long-chain fatty acid--CoA ligase [Chloroflexota bacterium]|nr:long-chain fatty acid--CoA ligase [Chloroflexota bacterium]
MEKPWLKHYETGVRATLEYPSVPMHQFLEVAASKYPDRTATIFGSVVHQLGGALMDAKLTYKQLNDQANRLANALTAMGVKKGDRVALYLPNCPQYIIGFYAILKIGAIVAPNNPLYVPRELEFQVNDAGAETIICISRFYPNVQKIRANTKLKNVIVTNVKEYFPPVLKTLFTLAVEKKEGHRVTLDPGDRWFPEVLASAPATKPRVEVRPEDTAVLLYTGGTTGVPKAAEITHKNLVANTVQAREWMTQSREGEDVIMTALPLYHSYAMTTCMNFGVYIAASLILIPNPREFDHVLKCIDRHKPTSFPGVPTMYVGINNYPDVSKYNLKSIKACMSGAAGLPVEVQKKFQDLTGARLVEGYGLSEATPVVTCNPIFGENRIGTIGVPWPDTECRIVDVETGKNDMPPGEAGELIAKGPQVMKGYWNKPEETRQTLRDGWLYTGDIGVMDKDGYIQLVDRKKDMIIVGGFNVYPREVEEVLFQHPKILEATVAGVPDPKSIERVKAYIVLKPGQTATVEEIMAFCKERLTGYKRPSFIEFRDSLPKTMVGKILRRQLVAEDKLKAATEKPPEKEKTPA